MARVAWEKAGDGTWFADFRGRSVFMSLLIETEDDMYVASCCPLDKSDYEVIGSYEKLSDAKKALETRAVDEDLSARQRRI